MPVFALVDCNNFYVSCERVFNPRLENKPVIVLSNNDGCIIARSNEAKQLGIPMGAPFYQWKSLCESKHVQVFSSNYELYGDMSHRMMTVLENFCPEIEIYSIDEAFLLLDSFSLVNLTQYTLEIRKKIKMWTGLPVSIGFSQTKTLAKIANHIAKNHTTTSVFDFCDQSLQQEVLSQFPIKKIWGIGNALTKRLQALHINTAKDLRDVNEKMLRLHFSVTMEKIIQELRGISCLPLAAVAPKKQIISSRSFGKRITLLQDLEEAISHYAMIASNKLRAQKSVTDSIYVFLNTNIFSEKERQYANGCSFHFLKPTADTGHIIHAAKKCLRNIYQPGYQYHKTGLILFNLMPNTIHQFDMLNTQDVRKRESIMNTIDLINQTWGRDTIFYCAEGIMRPWQIKRNKRSPRYTTCWKELVIVHC